MKMNNSIEDSCQNYSNTEFWLPEALDTDLEDHLVYHNDWRLYLNMKNKEEVSSLIALSSSTFRFGLYCRNVVKFFMVLSDYMDLPPEVLYLSIDMYDRFWLQYLTDTTANYKDRWEKTEINSIERKVLYAFSCLQIASKLSCTPKILTISMIAELMKKFGYEIKKEEIVKSEMEVFRTIGWTMSNVSILTYVEMFIEAMHHLLTDVRKSELIQVCVKVINVTFMFHKDIYTKLHVAFQQRVVQTQQERKRFLSIEGDSIRLAASVVCAGVLLYDPSNTLASQITSSLASITRYHSNDITVLTNIITHVILRNIVA